MNHRDIEVRSTGRESVLVSKAPPPPPTPPVFCMPYGAAPSGCFSLNSPPPPTPNLRFWLRSLAILTATTGFTSSLCVAPPTNLPLSLLRESFVIAIGFNVAAAHLCERRSQMRPPSFLSWFSARANGGGGRGGGGRASSSPPPSVLLHISSLFPPS